MEIVVFSLNAIVVYLLSDWIVRAIEQTKGSALKYRQVVFFGIFLLLILVTFELLKGLFAGP